MKNDQPIKIHTPLSNRWHARWELIAWRLRQVQLPLLKRLLDLTLTLPAFILLLPLFLIVALAIWLQDRGPVLYWQQRVGLYGRVFRFPKFRSMRTDSDRVLAELLKSNQHGANGITFKMRKDPRITPIGRFIRRTSIDELPQLWCVVKGEMSLVGPRPALVSEVAQYSLEDRARLSVKPGLTCIWQVSGRSEVPFDKQCLMDLDYIHQRTITADIKLIAKTVPAVVRGRGAY